MCGICGRLELSGRPADGTHVESMQARLAHRGPDDSTIWVHGPIALGHRRLSIIDVEGGKQPVPNERGDIVAILNGEIYNHEELRARLSSSGHRFRTRSDTEAIVHSYEEWGDDFVTHLHGMFAIALWDAGRQRLVLARDRLGIKPLFVCHRPGRFLSFASELGSLCSDREVPRDLDPVALDQYLSLQYVPAPRTGILSVEKVLPANLLTVEEGRVRVREFWDPAEVEPVHDRGRTASRLRTTLAEAVRSHLVSDVPVGSFLSGGVDSGIVTALMAESNPDPVTAITVGFTAGAFDESPRARALARRHGCAHVVRLADLAIGETFDRVIGRIDEPFADWSTFPTFLVAEAARTQVKVVLSGDGGDELFGGYARHRVERIEGVLRRLSRVLPTPLLRALLARYPRTMTGHQSLQLLTESRPMSVARKHAHGFFGRQAERRSLYGAAMLDLLPDASATTEAFAASFEQWYGRIRHRDPLTAALYLELKTYLVDDVLTKVDRMSMAHALEVRVPLLDHRVVELALSMPPAWKVGWRRGKRILRSACGDLLPADTWNAPKQGFDIPVARWLRDDLRSRAADLLLGGDAAARGIVSQGAVERLWRSHQLGQADHSRRLWALMMMEAWFRSLSAPMTGAASRSVAVRA